jgi:hypothetical protein
MLCRGVRCPLGLGGGTEGVVLHLELAVGVFEPRNPGLRLGQGVGVRVELSRGDAVPDDGLETVEFLGTLVEVVLEGLVLPPEILLDGFDLALEAADHGLDGLNGGKQVLAETGQHRGHGLEAGQRPPVDEAVVVRPVGAAQGRQTSPQDEEQVVALRELLFERVLELRETLLVLRLGLLELHDALVLGADGAGDMLVRLLECLELMLDVAVGLPFLIQHLAQLAQLKGVGLEEGIALLDDPIFFDERRLGRVEVADRVFEVPLEFCDRLNN